VLRLTSSVRPYAWGSRSFLADLQGREPTGEPEAELWIGAHPAAPSLALVAGRAVPLPEVIGEDPAGALGSAAERFGGLPFLLKVLAAAEPLSLQAHPSAVQAADGFAREERLGIPIDAPHRVFRDGSHKPELVCALTEFHALCGFRPAAGSVALLEALAVPALEPLGRRPARRR
jgi:mannose-6-phosphate isomerase